jgi:choline kinase
MDKKDYEFLALVMADLFFESDTARDAIMARHMQNFLADRLQDEYENFNRVKFDVACQTR